MEYTIKRSSNCYRPLQFENKKIERIVLHNGKEILHKVQQGWLEHYDHADHDPSTYFYGNTYDIIAIAANIRNARKVDLSKKDNFIIYFSDKDKGFFDSGYALYLYAPDYTYLKTIEHTCDDGLQIWKQDLYTFSLPCEVSWPHYNKVTEKVEYVATPINQVVLRGSTHQINTDRGAYIKELKEKINQTINRDLSDRDIDRLDQAFTISPK